MFGRCPFVVVGKSSEQFLFLRSVYQRPMPELYQTPPGLRSSIVPIASHFDRAIISTNPFYKQVEEKEPDVPAGALFFGYTPYRT